MIKANISLLAITIVFFFSCRNGQVTESRDPLKWPFSSSSIWNMPIGDSAIYVDAQLMSLTKGMAVTENVIIFSPQSPIMQIYANYTDWDASRNRCEPEGAILISAPCPNDFVYGYEQWGKGLPGGNLAILMADGRTIRQTQPFARCKAGGPGTSHYLFADQDIYGDGIYGSIGNSDLSAVGGTLRIGEGMPDSGPIRHVLKLALSTRENVYYDSETKGFRWPAPKSDLAAGEYYGKYRQAPPVKALRMGALLAIPDWITIDSLELETEPGKIVAAAFHDYGAYVATDAAPGTWSIISEFGPDGRYIDEFAKKWGMNFETLNDDSGWTRDLNKIYNSLHVVDNNGPNSIGGGGKPRQPLAPEFSINKK
jgi:hypothetical protein